MKKILLALLFLCSNAFASITDLKLSTAQIFDVQWSISGGKLNASGFNYIYASVNYATQTTSAARWTAAQTADATANGRYIGFFNSTTNPGTYGMAVFNSDGTTYKIINNTGSFRALADGAIFYNGNGMWGTLITTGQGYRNGQSGSWNVTQDYPSNAQLQAYTPPSDKPLASGETAAPAGGGSVAPSWPADSNITTTQTTQQTAVKGRVASNQLGNSIYLDQKIGSSGNTVTIEQTGSYNKVAGLGGTTYAVLSGTSNTVNIKQGDTLGKNLIEFSVTGNTNNVTIWQGRDVTNGVQDGTESGGHYAGLGINGNSNTVSVKQGNQGDSSSGHFGLMYITGSNNNVSLKQGMNGGKTAFITVDGSNNIGSVTQWGGTHYTDLMLTGNGHTADITQSGVTTHKATINLTNSGGASNVTLLQQGTTAQNINITQQCATLAGCSVSVTQGTP